MIYLDCNATTRIESEVLEIVRFYLTEEYGNPGSRSHQYGLRASRAVSEAQSLVAEVVDASADEVVFTSGATESNNIAILGLEEYARRTGKTHIVTSAIEHKAVLEPVRAMQSRGFEVTHVAPLETGVVPSTKVLDAITPKTVLVSVMHVNNETGVVQELSGIADGLKNSAQPDVYLHTDAAQGYGKELDQLRHKRIDMISLSGHKLFAPMGVGALILRSRDYDSPPLDPIMYGGGQQGGVRPGTIPTPLVAGLGMAARIALRDHFKREARCMQIRKEALATLGRLNPVVIGGSARVLPHVLNIAFPGIDGEALLLHLKGHISASTGSACTSSSLEPSHVLTAMELPEETVHGAVRLSWSHLTEDIAWETIAGSIEEVHG